jgi:hypothetical protein
MSPAHVTLINWPLLQRVRLDDWEALSLRGGPIAEASHPRSGEKGTQPVAPANRLS